MSITFSCQCGRSMTVGDEHSGKKVRCPDCKTVLVVPSAAGAGPSTTPGPAPAVAAPEPAIAAPAPAQPALGERVEQLERANARLRRRLAWVQWGGLAAILVLLAVSVLALGLAAVGAAKALEVADSTLAAGRFVVRDKAGNVRAELGVEKNDDVSLRLLAGKKIRAEIRVGADGMAALNYFSETGKEQVTLAAGPDAGLVLNDPRGDLRLQVGLAAYEAPNVSLRARELKPKIQFGVRPDDRPFAELYGPGDRAIPLIDAEGNPRSGQSVP